MHSEKKPIDSLVKDLQERAKELNCLYTVIEISNRSDLSMEEVFQQMVEVIPRGWQYPESCQAKIQYGEFVFQSSRFGPTDWGQTADITAQDEVVGRISVYYTKEMPTADEGPFLKEERKLLERIADWISHYIIRKRLGELFRKEAAVQDRGGWKTIVELLRRTNPQLLVRIARKMANYLCWTGSTDAERLLARFSNASLGIENNLSEEINWPRPRESVQNFLDSVDEIFQIALNSLGENETLSLIQRWFQEDRSSFLVSVLENPASPHSEVTDALDRYLHLDPDSAQLSPARDSTFRVSLIRRFLTDQPGGINLAKQYFSLGEFRELLHTVIFPPNSYGKLGGKSAGLLLANQILKKANFEEELLKNIKIPKTWYIVSDGILNFMYHNNLEDVVDQKYKEIGQVRQEYPYVVQVFKNSQFAPEIVNGLSKALDDFGENPLIVRSSSLLEDREGTSFAGKYKSLFIANQGTKQTRLASLMDAVAEVYASVFSPDPIQYRIEHGLMDVHEEMGVMIQEVVGKRVGDYFLPAYGGVAFSKNEFRWSPRIRREDGLVRLVVGLGTRAVDRLSDDYPVLLAPGQPDLRVNVTIDEIVRYSPKKIDVINLKTNAFETIDIREFMMSHGDVFESAHQIFSVLEQDRIRLPMGLHADYTKDNLVATFDGLRENTPFVKQIQTILTLLQEQLGVPVDIEFASDGESFYLLQCRAQSYNVDTAPAIIPADVQKESLVFSANKHISNGSVQGITHIVYVDPQRYGELETTAKLHAVGRAISKLNKILPKRRFILMGPGRWGSRGDIRLGVNVTYSDINNTAMLIEIARKTGEYVPDLSFGTHFFQDLVEEGIKYLPLFPDDRDSDFNESFFTSSENMLSDLLPQHNDLRDVVRVIDVPRIAGGLAVDVLMNGEINKAVAILVPQALPVDAPSPQRSLSSHSRETSGDHWRWRQHMAEEIASQIDPGRFGVKGIYLIGSTKNGNAGPSSDIDLVVHLKSTAKQRQELMTWLDGWSLCLSEMNYLRTGRKTDGLLDVHIVTDAEIEKQSSFGIKINAVTDQARKLPLGLREARAKRNQDSPR